MTNGTLFFSIIIPAHNEEKYLIQTLEHIQALNYSKNRYEVIVIENGSSDATLDIAQRYQSENLRVIHSNSKGVSPAKNIGIENISSMSDWVVFLDADTVLENTFLSELSSFLYRNAHKNFTIGTTKILPLPNKRLARAWFTFYDIGHRITKSSYSIQIAKTSVVSQFRFDEHISFGEDIEFKKFCLQYGSFFFFMTNSVSTSTRRFDSIGWWKIFFSWTFVAILPSAMKKKFSYTVVR